MIRSTNVLFPVVFSQWLVSLADGLLLPFVNLYMVRDLGFHPALAGTVLGLAGVGLIIGQLPGGALADRYGTRPVIVAGLLVGGTADFAASLTHNPILFALSYGTSLLSAGIMSPAFYQAVTRMQRAENLRSVSFLIAAQNGGIAGGALLALPLVSAHLHDIFYAAAVVDAIGACVATVFIRGDSAHRSPAPFKLRDWLYLPPRGPRTFWPIALAGFLTGVIYSQMWSTVPTVWANSGGRVTAFALLWVFNGGAIFFLEPRISRSLERRRNPLSWVAGASLIYAASVGVFAFGVGLGTIILGFVVLTSAELLYEPFPPTFYADAAPRGLTARYQGAGNLANAAGIMIGPVVGDSLLQWTHATTVWVAMVFLGGLAAFSVLHAQRPATSRSRPMGFDVVPSAIEMREFDD